jgi:hypothetical protein
MPELKCLLTWQCSSQVPGLSVTSSAVQTLHQGTAVQDSQDM